MTMLPDKRSISASTADGTLQDTLDDTALEQAIVEQREAVGVAERAFMEARERQEQQRKQLRTLEQEQERRRRAAAGLSLPAPSERPRRRRSTTGMDAVLGRDGVAPDQPFSSFRLLSLQRQEVRLNHTGEPHHQALTFVDRTTGTLLEAHSFGEARRYLDEGHALGRPGVPLQRQAIWYVGEQRSGWLRLDQLFVEQADEDEQ